MPYPLEATIITVWPCKTGEQPQGPVTAPAGRNGNAIEWPAVGAHQRQHLGLSPAGVLLHDASGGFKFRDDAATFAASIWIVFHEDTPSCTARLLTLSQKMATNELKAAAVAAKIATASLFHDTWTVFCPCSAPD
jgi:hypothetical protein